MDCRRGVKGGRQYSGIVSSSGELWFGFCHCKWSLKRNGLEILEVKSGVETFIEVIGTVVDDKTIGFLTCVDMGSNVDMYLYAWSTQHD